jgi:hypothetical protein
MLRFVGFLVVIKHSGYDQIKLDVKLNWGNPHKTPEITASDLISAAEKNLIRLDEFRKNAVKILGWELWEPEKS